MRKALFIVSLLCLFGLIGCRDGSDSHPHQKAELSAPPSDCFWTIEVTPGVDEADNVWYPEFNAAYWVAVFSLPSDALCFTLEGVFPYSRYMSLNSHDLNTGFVIDYILDRDIAPNLGSTNPFVP